MFLQSAALFGGILTMQEPEPTEQPEPSSTLDSPPIVEPPALTTPTDAPVQTVVIDPDQLPMPQEDAFSWLGLLPGFGVGAIISALIAAFMLHIIENKRQENENKRKKMELRRLDQRQWNQDIREAFVETRAKLTELKDVVSWTTLYSYIDEQKAIEGQFSKALKIRSSLAAVKDSVNIYAEQPLVDAFQSTVNVAEEFLEKFKVEGEKMTFPKEHIAPKRQVDYSAIEQKLLEEVRKALKTPDDW